MGDTTSFHRPLVAGIGIRASDGTAGTLTGLATRNSDGKKVLVTNLHVVAGVTDSREYQELSGNEELYQESVSADKKVGSLPAWGSG